MRGGNNLGESSDLCQLITVWGHALDGKYRIHRRCRVAVHRRDHVAVGIKCESDGGVPEHLRDEFDVHVGCKKDRRGHMPQGVEATYEEASCLSRPLKRLRFFR